MKKMNVRKTGNRITALLLLVLMLTNALCVNAAELNGTESVTVYEDVAEGDWFYEGVYFCAQNGIMVGVDDQHFEPQRTITRAEFITALYRLAGTPQFTDEHQFKDVSKNSYYDDAVSWGTEKKIVFGTTEATFSPDQLITREEIACLVVRYAEYIEAGFLNDGIIAELGFVDFNEVSSFAKDSVTIAAHETLMVGDHNGLFHPKNHAIRAEAAIIFMNLEEAIARTQPAVLKVHDYESGEVQEYTLTMQDTSKLRSLLKDEGWEETLACECLGEYELILDNVIYRLNTSDSYHQIKYENVYGGAYGAIDNEDTEVIAQIYDILLNVIG